MPSQAYIVRSQRYVSPGERARLIEEERDNAAREGRWPRAVRAQSRPILRRFPSRQAAENFAVTLRAGQPDTAELVIAIEPVSAKSPQPKQHDLFSPDELPIQLRHPTKPG
jgi:hypothetical protein